MLAIAPDLVIAGGEGDEKNTWTGTGISISVPGVDAIDIDESNTCTGTSIPTPFAGDGGFEFVVECDRDDLSIHSEVEGPLRLSDVS